MASVVSICNLALSNIAKPEIQDINDPDPEAVACKQFYAHSVETLLAAYPWRFAGKTVVLAELTNDRPGRWRFAYRQPTDCLKIRSVVDEAMASYIPSDHDGLIVQGGYAYDIEGTTIYADPSPAYLRYTWRLTDPTKFPPMFVEALSWHLAVRLAMPLTRDPKIRADAWQLAVRTSDQAAAVEANQVALTTDAPSEFIEARS